MERQALSEWQEKIIAEVGHVLAGLRVGAIGGELPLFTNSLVEADSRRDWIVDELVPSMTQMSGKKCNVMEIRKNEGSYYVKIMFVNEKPVGPQYSINGKAVGPQYILKK